MSDIELAVTELGDPAGLPMVALHGASGTHEAWRRMATEGIPSRRWVCMDLRGHGQSPHGKPCGFTQLARDVLATVDSLGLDQVDFVGHSLGALVTGETCRLAPWRVRSAILIDPPLMTVQEWLAFRSSRSQPSYVADSVDAVPLEFATVEESIANRLQTMGERVLSAAAQPFAVQEESVRLEWTENGRLRPKADEELLDIVFNDLANYMPISLGSFSGPVLVLVGGRTDTVSQKGLRALQARIGPQPTTVTIDAGHELMWEAFEQTQAAIAQFVEDA